MQCEGVLLPLIALDNCIVSCSAGIIFIDIKPLPEYI